MKTFEQFLQDKHALQYMGSDSDDEIPDNWSDWLCELDVDMWISLGQEFSNRIKESSSKPENKECDCFSKLPESMGSESIYR